VVVPAVMVRSALVGPAAVMVGSVPWRVVPGVVMTVRRRRVLVPRRVMPRVVMTVRRRRVLVPRRVMPRVVMTVRRRRVLVPRRMVPGVMMAGVRPVVIVMSPLGLIGIDAALVEPQDVPLAGAVPRRLRLPRGRDAA